MSHQRFRRVFRETERTALLKAIGECRRANIDAADAALINRKDIKRGCESLIRAIDDLAEILTGDREHFWAKAHSSPSTGLPPD